MEPTGEPAPKRLKLSATPENESFAPKQNPPTPLPPSFNEYIAIAQAHVEVSSLPDDLKNHSIPTSFDVGVRSSTKERDGYRVSLFVRGLRRPVQEMSISTEDQKTSHILEDSAKLESTVKYNAKAGLPLACVHATLRLTQKQTALEIIILWQDAAVLRDRVNPALLDMLHRYLPADGTTFSPVPELWDPRQFYDNVHVPEKNAANSEEIKINLLETPLYPFQRRAVRWLLSREGAAVQPSGEVEAREGQGGEDLPRGFVAVQSLHGHVCYVNHALGVLCTDLAVIRQLYGTVKGGILADEMGLGKTLEVIALMCLHPRRKARVHNGPAGGLRESRATLIITPPTILKQWKQEIQEHAPALKVSHYGGIKSYKEGEKAIDDLMQYDVVLTTYNVMAKEVHYVAEKPDRDLRHRPRADPPKSPLTEISWWRVCLDEAQMVETGVSAAATVARLVPRENAWAVTGTPLRKGHRDLFGLLLFLRYEPWCHSARLWDYLISYHRPWFHSLMGEVAMRHSKDFVREDLRLPPQSRHTITIPFTPIEEQHYAQLFSDLCEDCGLDRSGAPLDDDWDPESPATVEKMRTWLTRLRQTCLHPEVGNRNRKALGRSAGPLRTVQQVLDVMIEQNEGVIRSEQRNLLMSQIRRGQMQENAKDTKAAMAIWKAAYEESCAIVDECRRQLEAEMALQQAAHGATSSEGGGSEDKDDDEEEEPDSQLHTFRQRLRSALEVKHICIFFIANAYFQLKSDESTVKPESDEFAAWEKLETGAYEEAKSIRGELLVEVLRKANKLISAVRSKTAQNGLTLIPHMQVPHEYGGIESRKVWDKLQLYCEAMNVQAGQFRELRDNMITFLRQALIDEDEGVELQGDEYESSTKHQDEMYAYMEAMRALFADRADAISGQENLLIRQEMKQFWRSAKEGEGPAPELMLTLLAEREQKRVKISKLGSLRGIVAEIRQLITALQWQEMGGSARARAELGITNQLLQHAQHLVSAQTKALTGLEQEVNQFRETMNSRLDYYRALQKISDTVAPYDEEHVGEAVNMVAYQSMVNQEQRLSEKISSLLSKRRYLFHLKTESSSQSPRMCTICQCEFEVGTLTVCGHQFCKECIQLWYAEHRNCPVCKRRLHTADFHDITYKPAELILQAESPPSTSNSPRSSTDRSADQSIYSDISTATLNEIKNIDIRGPSFGSKVDFICRHLLWLRDHDPGSKAIIFSQYREFIDVLGRAFGQYKITFSRFDDKNGIEKFKSNPAVECFLLHAKAHSAGLNLVVASHVLLCEPLINTAIELQAIARVHRIGQHRSTTVWMYLIADTVEESIYDISVNRRLAHLKSNVTGSTAKGKSRSGTVTPHVAGLQENAIDVANSMELQAADLSKLLTAGKSGGEMVDQEDLWPCLFGRVKKRDPVMGLALPADTQPANGEIGRFLRADAVERRMAK